MSDVNQTLSNIARYVKSGQPFYYMAKDFTLETTDIENQYLMVNRSNPSETVTFFTTDAVMEWVKKCKFNQKLSIPYFSQNQVNWTQECGRGKQWVFNNWK